MENFGLSMLWFWAAYVVVTFIGCMHCIFNIYVLHMRPMDEHGMGEAYEKTKPWHPLYNLLLYPVAGWLYMRGLPDPTWQAALWTGLLWAGICIVFDFVAWVLVKHPWTLSFKEFYVRYQPWISMIYVIIFIAPLMGYWFVK
ncbi:MAG: hypothetical protein K2F84_04850 [Bacteroidales bacterium]|nr:hypothetical protein [Bacteroidales bacterium]